MSVIMIWKCMWWEYK